MIYMDGLDSCGSSLTVVSAKISGFNATTGNGTLQLFSGTATCTGGTQTDLPFILGECFNNGGSAAVVAKAGTGPSPNPSPNPNNPNATLSPTPAAGSAEHAAGILVAIVMTLSIIVSF
jgi:hypothetical protein